MRRPFEYIRSLPPRGWRDAVLQVVLFLLVYQGYQVVRGLVDGKEALAFANGERVIELERSLGSFFEPGFQQALLDQRWLIDIANFAYFNTHFVVTTAFLVWLYLFRNDFFPFVRNMFMVAMVLALIGYAAFPTAPPRFFPELRLHRHGRELHRDRAGPGGGELPRQPVRRGAEHAHRLRADDRGARRAPLAHRARPRRSGRPTR